MSLLSQIADLPTRREYSLEGHTGFDLLAVALSPPTPQSKPKAQGVLGALRFLLFAVVFNIAISFLFAVFAVKIFDKQYANVVDIFPLAFVFIDVAITVPIILAVMMQNGLIGLIFVAFRALGAYVLFLQAILGLILFSRVFGAAEVSAAPAPSLDGVVPIAIGGVPNEIIAAVIPVAYYIVRDLLSGLRASSQVVRA